MNAREKTISSDSDVFRQKPLPSSGTSARPTRRKKKFSEVSTKLEFIEGMRAIAALYVVIGHICGIVDAKFLDTGKSIAMPWLQVLMRPFWYGHLAVAAFIVISGYSLQYGLYQRGDGRVYGLGKFYRRRALRILPAYYACLAFSYWVCQTVTIPHASSPPFDRYVPITPESLRAHIFLVHNWSVDWLYKINGVLWSIAIEAQLYILFPFLILIMQKRSPLTLLAVVIVPTVLIINYLPGAGKTYSWFAILFALGMLAAHWSYRPSLKIGPKARTGFFLCLVGAVITGKIVTYSLSQGKVYDTPTLISSDLTFGLSIATLLYAMTVAPGGWIEKFFSMKWFVRIGIFSYSLYLLHHPLIQMLYVNKPTWIAGSEATIGYLLVVGLPVILMVSWLFSLIFERPFVKSRLPMSKAAQRAVERIPLPLRVPTMIEMESDQPGHAYLASGKKKGSLRKISSEPKKKKAKLY